MDRTDLGNRPPLRAGHRIAAATALVTAFVGLYVVGGATPASAHAGQAGAAPATSTQAATGEWRQVRLPFLWPTASVIDIAAPGPSDVWITGYQGAICIPQIASWGCVWRTDGNAVVRRWDGSEWKEQERALPEAMGKGPVTMVSAAAPDDVWVSDPAASGSFAHFDGAAFTMVRPAVPAPVRSLFANKSGTWLTTTKPNRETGLYRKLGDTWQAVDGGGVSYLMDVKARTATDAWAVGSTSTRLDGPAIAHWDGESWKPVDYPRADMRLTSVVPVSADEIWVTVFGANYLVRKKGSTWSRIDPPAGVYISDIAVDGAGTVWAGGHENIVENSTGYKRPVLMSYAGDAWQRVPVALPPNTLALSIDKLVSVPGTDSLWAVASSYDAPFVYTNG